MSELSIFNKEESKNWFTIKRVAYINNIDWRTLDRQKLKHRSILMNKQIRQIFDSNYGTATLYHLDVFKSVYPQLRYS